MKILSSILAINLFALAGQSADKVDFLKEVKPIFEKSCIQCHGPEKDKGDLRLDTKEFALKKGESITAIIPGDAEKSEVYRRIILPKDHDDVMPSKGDILTKVQTDLIKEWIVQGANWPDGTVLKDGGVAGESDEPAKLGEHKPSSAELKAIAKFEELGVSVRPIAMNLNWREANFRGMGSNATDTALAPLKDITGLLDLNLANTKITDAGLASLKGLTNLTHLHLEHTEIGDAGLVHLKDLTNLRYLNLFDTKVTDVGLEHLKGLSNLKNLHLWQTKVTDAGVENIQKALPNVNVVRGWEVSAAAKEDAKEKESAKK